MIERVLDFVRVFRFCYIVVWVFGDSPGGFGEVIRGGARVFLFVVCMDYVYDVLGIGCYLVCFWVSYCCEVWLIFGPRLEAGYCF